MLASRYVPLAENRPLVAKYQEKGKKLFDGGEDAQANRMKIASRLEDARKAGGRDYNDAMLKYGGQIVSEAINYMLFTESIITSSFRVIQAEAGNLYPYHLKIIPEIDVWRLSAHGAPPAVIKMSSNTQYFPTPYRIGTDRIYQYQPSVLNGNTEPDDDIETRAMYEIEQKIEDDLWTLLEASIGTFSNAWVYDTRIQDLPTTNSVDLSAQGGITKAWIQGVLAAVDQLPARTASGVVRGSQTATIKNIIIPSDAAQDIREWVSVVSSEVGGSSNADTISPSLQADMENRGVAAIQTMWGENLGIIKSKRTMGAGSTDWSKYAYVILGPVGRLIIWDSESKVLVHDDRLIYGEEGMSIHKTIAMDIPSPYCPNVMRVKIKS